MAGLLSGGPAQAILPPPSYGRGPAIGGADPPPAALPPSGWVIPAPRLGPPAPGVGPGPIFSLEEWGRTEVGGGYLPGGPGTRIVPPIDPPPSGGGPGPVSPIVSAMPEPGGLALMGMGSFALLLFARCHPRAVDGVGRIFIGPITRGSP